MDSKSQPNEMLPGPLDSMRQIVLIFAFTNNYFGERCLKYSHFICTAALVAGCIPAFAQTYSGFFRCAPPIDSPDKPAVNATAELTVKNSVAQLKRGSDKYVEVLQGTVVGKSLELKGEGHFFDRGRPWATQLKGSFDGNTFRAQGAIFNDKGMVRECETVLIGSSAPAVRVAGVSPSFDCQKATIASEKMICGNPRLAALDASMGQAYKAALLQATDKQGLQANQSDWRKSRRDTCATEACMQDVYNSRLAFLRQSRTEVAPSASVPLVSPAPVVAVVPAPAPVQVTVPTPAPAPAQGSSAAESPMTAASEPNVVPSEVVNRVPTPLQVVAPPEPIVHEPVRPTVKFTVPPFVWQLLLGGAVTVGILLAVSAWLKRRKTASPTPSNGSESVKPLVAKAPPTQVIQTPTVQMGMHRVVLQGVKSGENLTDTEARLGALLKANPQQVKVLFATQGYVLKRGLPYDVAEKYKAAINAAGAVCEIIPDHPISETLDIDLPVAATNSLSAAVTQLRTSAVATAVPTAGAFEASGSAIPSTGNIEEPWKTKFVLIDRAGGVKMTNIRSLTGAERRKVTFNIFGFLFFQIYYVVKGMWKKAIVLTVIGVSLSLLLDYLAGLMGFDLSHGTVFVTPVIFGVRANIDYYKKMMLGDNGWL